MGDAKMPTAMLAVSGASACCGRRDGKTLRQRDNVGDELVGGAGCKVEFAKQFGGEIGDVLGNDGLSLSLDLDWSDSTIKQRNGKRCQNRVWFVSAAYDLA